MILTLENSHNKRQVGKNKIKMFNGLNIFVALNPSLFHAMLIVW